MFPSLELAIQLVIARVLESTEAGFFFSGMDWRIVDSDKQAHGIISRSLVGG